MPLGSGSHRGPVRVTVGGFDVRGELAWRVVMSSAAAVAGVGAGAHDALGEEATASSLPGTGTPLCVGLGLRHSALVPPLRRAVEACHIGEGKTIQLRHVVDNGADQRLGRRR